jgi:putative membrane protein
MMWWYGDHIGFWGPLFMGISTVLFWGLIILGIIALVRYLGGSGRVSSFRSTPELLLAERFARGEIDEQEYHRRLDTLRGVSQRGVKP